MDLGCLDLGCLEVADKHSSDGKIDSESKDLGGSETVMATSKVGKSKSPKGPGQSALSALNKFASQIKKPSHRKNSPLNWFPRKKVDSYLNRKIRRLQEVDGMNSTLDETLGDSNPHYSRVLREQIAVREAAHRAMEARKAALVEASWCRILRAARIQTKEAEAQLLEAEKFAVEAFEAAMSMGVIMYDKPNSPRKPSLVETSSINGGRSTTHTVTASFETAFEVDKEVAAAVKTAFTKLANCHSFNKDEFKDLLRKISQNPDSGNNLSEISSECESESGSELEYANQKDECDSQDAECKVAIAEMRKLRRQSLEKLNLQKLVDLMLQRIRCLQEDELSSLATIVATCGLNAALAEVESCKLDNPDSTSESLAEEQTEIKQAEMELPSLDKYLVKHTSKLEREVQEAKIAGNKEWKGRNKEISGVDEEKASSDNVDTSSVSTEDLGNILVKHSSKLEKNIEEAKNSRKSFDMDYKKKNSNPTSAEQVPDLASMLIKHSSKLQKEIEEMKNNCSKPAMDSIRRGTRKSRVVYHAKDALEVPSLDKFLVKRVSRLEKEVQEAKSRRKVDTTQGTTGKENIDSSVDGDQNPEMKKSKTLDSLGDQESLDKILVKPVHWLEREKMKRSLTGPNSGNSVLKKKQEVANCESLDKVLVKHVSRLEREKMRSNSQDEMATIKRNDRTRPMQTSEEASLDQVLVKHKSRLEREKMAATEQPEEQARVSVSRREARERELQEAWGGLSFGDSMRPHISKLERDKAAWIKAEEEERKLAMEI